MLPKASGEDVNKGVTICPHTRTHDDGVTAAVTLTCDLKF